MSRLRARRRDPAPRASESRVRPLARRLAVGELAPLPRRPRGAVRLRDLPQGCRRRPSGDSPYVDPEAFPRTHRAVRLPAAARDRADPCDRAPRHVGGSSPVGSSSRFCSSPVSSGRSSCSTSATGAATRSRSSLRPRSRTSSTGPSGRCWHCSSRSRGGIATGSPPRLRPRSGGRARRSSCGRCSCGSRRHAGGAAGRSAGVALGPRPLLRGRDRLPKARGVSGAASAPTVGRRSWRTPTAAFAVLVRRWAFPRRSHAVS